MCLYVCCWHPQFGRPYGHRHTTAWTSTPLPLSNLWALMLKPKKKKKKSQEYLPTVHFILMFAQTTLPKQYLWSERTKIACLLAELVCSDTCLEEWGDGGRAESRRVFFLNNVFVPVVQIGLALANHCFGLDTDTSVQSIPSTNWRWRKPQTETVEFLGLFEGFCLCVSRSTRWLLRCKHLVMMFFFKSACTYLSRGLCFTERY